MIKKQPTLLINSIFIATEGEGIRIGVPQIFIRVQGCRIGCKNCDTPEALNLKSKSAKSYTKNQIIKIVNQLSKSSSPPLKRLSITGGDPLDVLHQETVKEIIKYYHDRNFYINIEAAGNVIAQEIFDLVDFISFDYKTPSSGKSFCWKKIIQLADTYPNNKIQIKSVISNLKDFETTLDTYKKVKKQLPATNLNWVLTPSYVPNADHKTFIKLFKNILKWNTTHGGPFRVIGQQHKWIFGPTAKNV